MVLKENSVQYFNYISKEKEHEIIQNPALLWSSNDKCTYDSGPFDSVLLQDYQIDDVEKKVEVESILCYSEQFLTIAIRTTQKTLTYRDRAYQNGDGFHIVLAKPNSDGSPSREFYVIGASPLEEEWQEKFVWYRNVDLASTHLKGSTLSHIELEDGFIFMLQIPWYEIEPLQGFFYENYGYNVSYVQATDNGKNIYILKEDNFIQSEQSPREYVICNFEKPRVPKQTECQIRLSQKHCEYSSFVSLEIALNSSNKSSYRVTIIEGEKLLTDMSYNVSEGLSIQHLVLDHPFAVGEHQIEIKLIDSNYIYTETKDLFVYKQQKFRDLSKEISRLSMDKQIGFKSESINALRFYNNHLLQELDDVKHYESFNNIESYYKDIVNKLKAVKNGDHLFETGEVIRLGHLSEIDNTLQPYSLYIPKHIKDTSKATLFVFLHGSGSDDTVINYASSLRTLADETSSILLSPFARGTSHMYTVDNAMEDVVELTHKIKELFSIEESNILLGGFSMGGYGTYRLFDYAPNLYKKLVVLSGHPSLGEYFGGPNYTQEHHLSKFQEVPMIIFHGGEDLNCEYEEQKSFFKQLMSINKSCEVHIKEDVGHCGLIAEWYPLLLDWMNKYS